MELTYTIDFLVTICPSLYFWETFIYVLLQRSKLYMFSYALRRWVPIKLSLNIATVCVCVWEGVHKLVSDEKRSKMGDGF